MKRICLLLLLILFAGSLNAQNISNLRLKTVNNKNFYMKDQLKNGAVVIAFWATWCKPCRKELPALKPILKKYEQQGLTIIAISIDSPRSLSKVKTYVRKSDLPYLFLLDPNGQQSSKLLVKDVPYTMLANQQGEIIYTHRGYKQGDEKELESKIAELLKSK